MRKPIGGFIFVCPSIFIEPVAPVEKITPLNSIIPHNHDTTQLPRYHTLAPIVTLYFTIAMIPHIAGWYPTWYKTLHIGTPNSMIRLTCHIVFKFHNILSVYWCIFNIYTRVFLTTLQWISVLCIYVFRHYCSAALSHGSFLPAERLIGIIQLCQ